MRSIDRANLLGAATGAGIAIGSLISPVDALASPNTHQKLSANGPALSAGLGRASMELNTVLQDMGPNSCLAISIGDEMGISPSDSSQRANLITSGGLRVVERVVAQNETYPDELACHNSSVKKTVNKIDSQEAFKISFKKVPRDSNKDFKKTSEGYVLKKGLIEPGNEAVLSTLGGAKDKAPVTNKFDVNVSYGINQAAIKTGATVEDCSTGYTLNSNISTSVENAVQAKLGDIHSKRYTLKGTGPFSEFHQLFNTTEKNAVNSVTRAANSAENGTPICLENLNPQNLTISSEVQSQLQIHEGWLPSQGCSAYIFYNGPTPIGIATARHCFEDSKGDLNITTGSNGQPEINLNQALIVATGESTAEGDMNLVGTISELEIGTGNTNDFVFGAFGDNTIAQVKALYNQQALTPAQITALPKGTEMVDTGYPAFQGTNTGAYQQQSVAESLIGFGSTGIFAPGTTTVAENLNVMFTAAIKNADGAAATPGISGSGEVAVINNQPEFDGVATGISDFDVLPAETSTPAGQQIGLKNKESAEDDFGVNLDGFDEESIYSYTPPSVSDGVEDVATNVDTSNSILSASAELRSEEFAYNFFDPSYPVNVIDGLLYMPSTGTWVNDAAYTYDPISDTFSVAYYDQQSQGFTWMNCVNASQSLQGFTVYSNPGESAPTLVTSPGGRTTNKSVSAFTDSNGLNVGQTYASAPTPSGNAYTIAIGSNDQPYFTPISTASTASAAIKTAKSSLAMKPAVNTFPAVPQN